LGIKGDYELGSFVPLLQVSGNIGDDFVCREVFDWRDRHMSQAERPIIISKSLPVTADGHLIILSKS
jgi:hypothetical protein